MSCCGAARPQATDKSVTAIGTRSVPVGGGTLQQQQQQYQQQQQQQFPVSLQPAAHPGINPFPPPADASTFRSPDIITPPPPAFPMTHLNGINAHSPPPSASTWNSSSPPSPPLPVPQMGIYTGDPNAPLSPLRRPSPIYPTSGSPNQPNLLSTYQSSATMPSLPPVDEGRMSVSIDFGERRPPELNLTPRSQLTVMVQELPSLAW